MAVSKRPPLHPKLANKLDAVLAKIEKEKATKPAKRGELTARATVAAAPTRTQRIAASFGGAVQSTPPPFSTDKRTKPCPVCKAPAKVYTGVTTYRTICSATYDCGVEGPKAHSFEDAITRWNRMPRN